ncbi:PDK repeat-containing protein, partial [Thermoplasmatales archaeon SCGC AB-539-N05]
MKKTTSILITLMLVSTTILFSMIFEQPVKANSGESPVADFTYTPPNPLGADFIQFTDMSVDYDGTIIGWWWDLGDHYYTDLQNPIHCYRFNGVYMVTLTVTDDNGLTDTVTMTVNAKPPNQPPVADASLDQTVTDSDDNGFETVTLDGSGSYDPDGNIVSYEWTEGSTMLGNTEIITPSLNVGTYTITLTIIDNEDATKTDDVTITVKEYASPPSGPTELFFDDFESGTLNNWDLYSDWTTPHWDILVPPNQPPDHDTENHAAHSKDYGYHFYMYMELKNPLDLSTY